MIPEVSTSLTVNVLSFTISSTVNVPLNPKSLFAAPFVVLVTSEIMTTSFCLRLCALSDLIVIRFAPLS